MPQAPRSIGAHHFVDQGNDVPHLRTNRPATARGRRRPPLRLIATAVTAGVALASGAASTAQATTASTVPAAGVAVHSTAGSATPIKHLVVIFGENVSFDHYFGTYPHARNPPGEPAFNAKPGTPKVNGLSTALLTDNPNLSNPHRFDRSQDITCGPSNNYTLEQQADDNGKVDKYVQTTGHNVTLAQCMTSVGQPAPAAGDSPDYAVMDYYDGNTVTGLWNYAQHFAMSDNAYGTVFGPSTPGALAVTAGNTYGATCGDSGHTYAPPGATVPACPAAPGNATPGVAAPAGPGTVFGDSDPYFDGCSAGSTIAMGGRNIGDLLNARGITWGWFQGGFRPSSRTASGAPVCDSAHPLNSGVLETDYSAHHEPFQYYPQTANPLHLPPTSTAMIGKTDQANHQYDLSDFWAAADSGRLPAVSYLKAARYQDAHSGNSGPLEEQQFIVDTINRLEKLPAWSSTAVIVTYDDTNGWYDHQMGPLVRQSQTPVDALTGAGACGTDPSKVPTSSTGSPEQARCGYGPRVPFLVVSPYAKANTVDHHVIDQSSVVRFIEDNWHLSRLGNGSADAVAGSITSMFRFHGRTNSRFFLDPDTGRPVAGR